MPERPLLVFPEHASAERQKKSGGPGRRLHVPTHAEQIDRVEPQLRELARVVTAKAARLQATPSGVEPEHVLVFETAGSLEEFAAAVRKIEGMEWLGEWVEDDSLPDTFFYTEDAAEAPIATRLYFVIANQRAMDQLLRLWQLYATQPESRFPWGQGRWKELFRHLRTVRRWDVRDRIVETGVLDDWRQRLAHGAAVLRMEAEFWFRSRQQEREWAEAEFAADIAAAGGRIVSSVLIEEIAYHAIVAELPAAAAEPLLNFAPVTELPTTSGGMTSDWLYVDQVMFFRPVGQIFARSEEPASSMLEEELSDVPAGDPIAALLDGLPVENHSVLSGRLLVDDPEGWAASYPVMQRRHGTAMASLVTRGDLARASAPIRTPLYVRPVLVPEPSGLAVVEVVPDDVTVVDLVHGAIRRMFDNNQPGGAVAKTVKIVNLSVADPSRLFFQFTSPWARLLDWLSYEYNILFVVSVGNHSSSLVLNVPRGKLAALSSNEVEREVLRSIIADGRNRRLLSPAESINALSVGSCHRDVQQAPLPANLVDPLHSSGVPSVITAVGLGFRRSIKPDILNDGGRQPCRPRLGTGHSTEQLEIPAASRPRGLLVAQPGPGGEVNRVDLACGTSNAAALTTRAAVEVVQMLEDLVPEESGGIISDEYYAVLAKTLVVHSAGWHQSRSALEGAIAGDPRVVRETITRLIGYGPIDVPRVIASSDARATVLGADTLTDGGAHIFRLPIPPSLSGRRVWRRLTATLGWFTPVRPLHQKYRGAALWFDLGPSALRLSRTDADWQATQRGTVQHEVFEGDEAVAVRDGDSVTIHVNCRADASRLRESIRYALAVTLEASEELKLPIYDEIRSRIRPRVAVATRP